jgi:hypothetical protein
MNFGTTGFFCALDPFDDQRARGSAQKLFFAEAMDVRMVPVKAGWFVLWNAKAILEGRVARLHGGLQHVVLMADGRNGQSMEVQVSGDRIHDSAGAGVIRSMRVRVHRRCAAMVQVCERVGEVENDQIAGRDAQIRRFVAGRIGITVAGGTICLCLVVGGKIGFENALLTTQVIWLDYCSAGLRAWTDALCVRLRSERKEKQKDGDDPDKYFHS